MQPTWKDERFGVELYLADCLEVLPHLPIVFHYTGSEVVQNPLLVACEAINQVCGKIAGDLYDYVTMYADR